MTINSWDAWFQNLANELSLSNSVIKEENEKALLIAMKDYRASGNIDDTLRATYPTERAIDNYLLSKPPHKKTIDFVLSFLDEHDELNEFSFSKIAYNKIRALHKPVDLFSNNLLRVEEFRRVGYWKKKQQNLIAEMEGVYVLHRYNVDNLYRKEICYLQCNYAHKQFVRVYWNRLVGQRNYTYVGDLWVGHGFLSGSLMRKSTDQLMNPVSMIILQDENSIQNKTVFSGTFSGTSGTGHDIFHYPVAIEKLDKDAPLVEVVDIDSFSNFADQWLQEFSFQDSDDLANVSLKRFLHGARHITRGGDIGKAIREK